MIESTPSIKISELKNMVSSAPYPVILCDDELKTLAYSNSFRHSFLVFSKDLSGLVGVKRIDLIKQARENCNPLCIRCGKERFETLLQISWLRVEGASHPILLGVAADDEHTVDDKHLSMAYSCVIQSENPLRFIFSGIEFGKRALASNNADDIAAAFERMENNALQLLRQNMNLHMSLDAFTGAVSLKKEYVDISTILAAVIKEVRKATAANEIKITFKRPHMPIVVFCDVTQITRALAGCLYSLVCFTHRSGRLIIKLTYDKESVKIEMTDPIFSMPEEMRERVMFQDVIIDNGHRCGGLYHPFTIIDKHNGKLETTACKPLGQSITVTLPMPEPGRIAMCERHLDDFREMIAFWTRFEFQEYN